TVVRVATDALTKRSKDIQIAAWLTEAVTRTKGFPGLRDGLRVLRGLQETFWDGLHPAAEDGDLGFRAAVFHWFNEKFPEAVLQVPMTDPAGEAAYGWLDWKESREVDNLALRSPDKHAAALAAGRIPGE